MTMDLAESYRYCRRLARRSASNFYYSFLLLPRAKRQSMCALYAFLRHTDDLSDGDDAIACQQATLAAWRDSLHRAVGGTCDHPILPAIVDVVRRCELPVEYLLDVIDGVEMDLNARQYESFGELEDYCYHVASAVGLACIHVWGFSDAAALHPARQLGVAFQLTNILRDLKEDAARGRVYLPAEDLRRFDYGAEELAEGVRDERFRGLMQFEIARAEEFYAEGATLAHYLSLDGRRALAAMVATYSGLLAEIKRRDGDVFTSRVRLSGWHKLRIATRSLLQPSRTAERQPAGVSR